jgi:hypothetical protein
MFLLNQFSKFIININIKRYISSYSTNIRLKLFKYEIFHHVHKERYFHAKRRLTLKRETRQKTESEESVPFSHKICTSCDSHDIVTEFNVSWSVHLHTFY